LKRHLVNVLKILLFFGVGISILYLVYQSQNAAWQEQCALDGLSPAECGTLLDKVINDFRTANYFWLLLVLLAFGLSNVSRTMRWMMLLHPLGYRPKPINGFFTIMLGYFANLGFPRIGEVIRAGTFARYERIKVEKVMGTVVSDRLVDVLSMAIVMGVAFLVESDRIWEVIRELGGGEGNAGGLPSWIWWLGGLGLVGLLAGWLLRKQLARTAFFQKIMGLVKGFAEGVQTIRKLDRPFWFIFHSLNIWFMYYLMTYLGFFAFGPTADLTPMAGLMVFVLGALGILIPSPGGMGTYHVLVGGTLALLYGINGADAFSFANILFFTVQIGGNVLFGLLALIILPVINRSYVGSNPSDEDEGATSV
jgi:uncharacterized membrane protein YbhN (UPF0104 family)